MMKQNKNCTNPMLIYNSYGWSNLYLLLILMQQINEKSKLSPLFVDTQFVPAKMHHLTIINTSVSPIPTVLPYYGDDITLQDLTLQISRIAPAQSMLHLELQEAEENVFETAKEKGASLKEIKFKEGRHRIDGDQVICTTQSQINLQQILRKKAEGEGRERCDLCCIMLANKSDVLHLSLEWNSQEETQLKILQQVNELYGVQLSVDDLKFHKVTFQCNTQEGLTNIRYHQQQTSSLHHIIFQTEGLAFVGITIITNKFSMASHIKKEEKQPIPRLIEIILNQFQIYKMDFDRIKQYKTKQLLGIFSVKDPETKGLKIMGEIYEPDRSLEDLQSIYNGAMFNHLTAELAQQFQVFIEGVNKSPALTSNQLKRLQDDSLKMEKVSFRQLGKSKLNKQITPLLLFNSNCQVHSQKDTFFKLLYHIIHRYIRNYFTHFNSFFDDSMSSRFVRGLHEQLKMLPVYEGQAWRRVGYELPIIEGQTLTFNNFIIASKRDDFLQMGIYPARGCKETFLKIFSVTGRVVGSNTSFEKLQQIIFQPFTKFKVTQRLEDQKTIYLTLSEIVQPPTLTRTGIILWVDDKVKEGKEFFRHLRLHKSSLLLYQLISTAQLIQWIKDHEKLLTSQCCNIIMISNMKRIEEGKENNIAGIESLRVVRTSITNCKSILYIGSIQNTKANLVKNHIDPNSLFITNTANSLLKYLVECLQPKPIIKGNSQQKLEKQSMQQLLQFIKFNQSINPFVIVKETTINEEKAALYKKPVTNSIKQMIQVEPSQKKQMFPLLGKKMEVTQKNQFLNKPKQMSQIMGDQEYQPHPTTEAEWKLALKSKLKVSQKKTDDII